MCAVLAVPSSAVLEHEKAYKFEVFVTTFCSCVFVNMLRTLSGNGLRRRRVSVPGSRT